MEHFASSDVRAKPPPVMPTGRVQPADAIKGAWQWLEANQWCQGQEPGQTLAHARDASGQTCPIFNGMADKAEFNPNAVALTAYGAIVRVISAANVEIQRPDEMWQAVAYMAEQGNNWATGGTNYLHPLHNYNEVPTRQKAEVIRYLQDVENVLRMQASALEAPEAGPFLGLPKQIEHTDQQVTADGSSSAPEVVGKEAPRQEAKPLKGRRKSRARTGPHPDAAISGSHPSSPRFMSNDPSNSPKLPGKFRTGSVAGPVRGLKLKGTPAFGKGGRTKSVTSPVTKTGGHKLRKGGRVDKSGGHKRKR